MVKIPPLLLYHHVLNLPLSIPITRETRDPSGLLQTTLETHNNVNRILTVFVFPIHFLYQSDTC